MRREIGAALQQALKDLPPDPLTTRTAVAHARLANGQIAERRTAQVVDIILTTPGFLAYCRDRGLPPTRRLARKFVRESPLAQSLIHKEHDEPAMPQVRP